MKSAIIALAVTLALAAPSMAQDHSGHGAASAPSEAAAAYEAANAAMHADMAVELTGDADVDFIRSMIPHHQGAVEMAKIVLKYGTDPEVKALAEAVIAAQDAEIEWMEKWLASKGY